MAIDNLSQELIDTIIDHASIKRDDLLACSLSWRRFLPRSQFHLFSYIRITSTKHTYLTSTREMFERRPILKTYIRFLKICYLETTAVFWRPLYENNEFVQLMRALCPNGQFKLGLESYQIPIGRIGSFQEPVSWGSFAQVFWQPFIAPNVTSLDLNVPYDIPFPLEFLFQCPKLITLSTNNIFPSPGAITPPLDLPSHHLHLTSLTIDGYDTSMYRLARALLDFGEPCFKNRKLLEFDQFRTLDSQLNSEEDFRAMDDIIARSTETLEFCKFRMEPKSRHFNVEDQESMLEAIKSSKLHLTVKLPAFKRLGIHFPSGGSEDNPNKFLIAAELVRAFTSNSKLSRLSLQIRLLYPEDSESWQWASYHHDWRPLDEALFDLGQIVRGRIVLEIFVVAMEGFQYVSTGPGDWDAVKDHAWKLGCEVNLEGENFLRSNLPITSTSEFVSCRYNLQFNIELSSLNHIQYPS
ncbi:hypothetical protein CPB83DRAFT_843384 [Crepidotus variabilis]|uniref:Uncharacterized protein n=1 Tax=Crepidotus variabilis TaxID=179855 RepID=A0A9P6EUR0_9AGAR|nr:hypothetical protein CPB83DRAFT_843384 [Crepidotus variabilis]